MTSSVISTHKFRRFRELYANVYDDSLWGVHEAVTDMLKGSNLHKLQQKNKVLNQILNQYIEISEAGKEIHPLGNFYQQRSLSNR